MEESNSKSKFKRVCVFCGSNSGHRKVFSDAALDLGNELVSFFYILDCDCVSCSSLIALLGDVPLFSYPTIHWVFVKSHLVVLISIFPVYMNYRWRGRLIWCTVEEVLG